MVETPKTIKVLEPPRAALRLPTIEKKAMTQVDVDLALSTEASETETENYKDVTATTVHETYSDVEPSSPERVDVPEQQQEPEVTVKLVMLPEILADFTESIVTTDEDEPKLLMDMPIVSHTNGEDTRIVHARSPNNTVSTAEKRESKIITSPVEVDVTARVPTKPAKVHTPPRRKISVPGTSTMSEVSMDCSMPKQHRVKSISGLHLANAAMNFHLTTTQVAEQIAIQYALDDEQRLGVVREIQKLRLGAKTLALQIRSAFPLNVRNDDDRSTFLSWLEGTTRLAASFESDDSLLNFVSTASLPTRH